MTAPTAEIRAWSASNGGAILALTGGGHRFNLELSRETLLRLVADVGLELEPPEPADRSVTVPCPRCGAPSGAPCRPRRGVIVHRARVREWRGELGADQ